MKPETWERRVAAANSNLAIVESVAQVRANGVTEAEALARVAPQMGGSTYRRLRLKYGKGGLVALISHRPAGTGPRKVTPEVRRLIGALRMADPHIAVERIGEVVEAQVEVKLSPAQIKRLLAADGLNRPRGGGSRRPPVAVPLQFAGGEFFKLGDQQLGYSAALTEMLAELREDLPTSASEDEPAGEPATSHRDEQGHFTAAYNQAQVKGDADLGPAFRSVAEKRLESDLQRRKLVHEKPETIQRKVLATLALPLLTDTAKAVQLDDYKGGHGVAEFGGPYRGESLTVSTGVRSNGARGIP
jgi:hypothetical protein